MIRRLILLLVIMAIPVLTALGTQQLARTTAPPALPTDPVTTTVEDTSPDATQNPDDDATPGPRSDSVAPVVPGTVDQNGGVTAPGGFDSESEDDGDGDSDVGEDDDDIEPDDLPESGVVDR